MRINKGWFAERDLRLYDISSFTWMYLGLAVITAGYPIGWYPGRLLYALAIFCVFGLLASSELKFGRVDREARLALEAIEVQLRELEFLRQQPVEGEDG